MDALLSLSAAAWLLAVCLIPPIKRLAWRWGLVDHPAAGAHKSHQIPIPYGGGPAIFLAWCLALAGGSRWFAGAVGSGEILLISGAGLLALLGLVDDWGELSPLPRFAIQFLVAGALVAIRPEFRLPAFANAPLVCVSLSALWIAAMANAFNFLDNMDGLSGGIAAIALLGLGAMSLYSQQLPAAVLSLALLGATAGFLIYNAPPASIFMGDAGGLFLGFVAGCLSAQLSHHHGVGNLAGMLAPLLALAVPVYDLSSVVLIRLCRGVPPWKGDHNHLSHRLTRLGLSRQGAVLVIYVLVLGTGLAALETWRSGSNWLLLGVGFLVLVGAGLEFAARDRLLQKKP